MPEQLLEAVDRDFLAVTSQERSLDAEEILELARETQAEGLLITARVGLDAEAIRSLPPSIRMIATLGAGSDHIAVDVAATHGIRVTSTPGVVTDATADLAIMLMLCACRRAAEYIDVVRGGWGRRLEPNEMLGRQFSGRRLGIVGMGRIGTAVARRARAFGLEILYHSRHPVPSEDRQDARFMREIDDLFGEAEILTLHLPATPETEGLIDAPRLALLPRGAIIVNTSRGQIVDENALIAALQSGHVAAAGLDVFRNEPNIDPRWRTLPQVFLTPHMGSATTETRTAMFKEALQSLQSALR